jgi:hypothetical protein
VNTLRRTAIVALVTVLAPLGTAVAAHADGVYHSAHIPLAPVGSAPLRSGFVENSHANGPNNYAHELYVLNGAEPDASYDVSLSIWTANLTCSGSPTLAMTTATVATNTSGNAVGQKVFTPADADGLRGLTVSGMWTISMGGTAQYATGCEVVTLD